MPRPSNSLHPWPQTCPLCLLLALANRGTETISNPKCLPATLPGSPHPPTQPQAAFTPPAPSSRPLPSQLWGKIYFIFSPVSICASWPLQARRIASCEIYQQYLLSVRGEEFLSGHKVSASQWLGDGSRAPIRKCYLSPPSWTLP